MDLVWIDQFRAEWPTIEKGNINSGLKNYSEAESRCWFMYQILLSCFHGMDNITWIQWFLNISLRLWYFKREKQVCLTPCEMAFRKTTVPLVYHFLIFTSPLTPRCCSMEVSEEYWKADICKWIFCSNHYVNRPDTLTLFCGNTIIHFK